MSAKRLNVNVKCKIFIKGVNNSEHNCISIYLSSWMNFDSYVFLFNTYVLKVVVSKLQG